MFRHGCWSVFFLFCNKDFLPWVKLLSFSYFNWFSQWNLTEVPTDRNEFFITASHILITLKPTVNQLCIQGLLHSSLNPLCTFKKNSRLFFAWELWKRVMLWNQVTELSNMRKATMFSSVSNTWVLTCDVVPAVHTLSVVYVHVALLQEPQIASDCQLIIVTMIIVIRNLNPGFSSHQTQAGRLDDSNYCECTSKMWVD